MQKPRKMQEKLSTFTVQMAASTGQLGPNIAAARSRARLTQAAVAQRMGVNLSSYIRWEHGKATPRWPNLESLAHVLSIDVADLLDDGLTSTIENAPTLTEQILELREGQDRIEAKLDAVLEAFMSAEALAEALDRRRDEQAAAAGAPTTLPPQVRRPPRPSQAGTRAKDGRR